MSCFFKYSIDTTVEIPSFAETNNVIFYEIQVKVKDIEWTTKHRYRDFSELHEKLVSEQSISKKLLPPKKVIGNKNPTFIEQRRKELEEYIQNLLGVFRITMPRIFVEFLELNKYDIIYLLHDLAQYFCTSGENLLWSAKEYNFSSLELHAISERMRLPCPPNDDNNNYDFSHILDFCSQIETIIITPSKSCGELKDNVAAVDSPIGTSNLKPGNLSFDLNAFRNLTTLKVYGVSSEFISDISMVKKLLRDFHVHNTPVTRINQILMCDLLHKNKEIGSVEKWDHIELLDLSENQIGAIDESITLAPKVKVLDLSQNRLTNISNLSSLPELRELNLSANLISDCVDWNVKLGNLVSLNLSQNKLKSVAGLRKMYSLVNLDLSCNLIEDLDEIGNIACLPLLENLILTGNPLAGSVDYRPRVLARFDDRASDICLDNEKGTPKELDMALVLAALNNSTRISRT